MKIYIETERLILREIVPEDLDGMFELDADPEVHRYLGNKPVVSKEQTIEIIKNVRQQYIDNGIARWAVIEKSSNNFIGWSGLKLENKPTNNHVNYYDIGYRFLKKYWGQGYAYESANASLQYAFHQLKVSEVFASAACDNIASNKILQKIGLQFIETFYYDDIKCNWYGLVRSEFEIKNG